MTDKWYICLTEFYPYDISVYFRGYNEGNQKIVKRIEINLTESGEIASVVLSYSSYIKTKDRIKQISTEEALEKLKKGESGYYIEKDDEIVSVSLSWSDTSTKDYQFPMYCFSILPKGKNLDNMFYVYVRGWKFEY